MARDRAMFVSLNRADEGTITASSEQPTQPASRLQDRLLYRVWRSTGTTETLDIDFGIARIIDVVALLAHNLTQTSTIRVRIGDDPTFAAWHYDSGTVRAWPTLAGFGSLPWGVWSWGDLLSTEEAAGYRVGTYVIPDQSQFGRYCRIDLSDPSNPDGFLQAGRLIAAPAYTPAHNINYGWDIQWRDDSRPSKSLGGQTYVDHVPRYRVVRVSLEMIDEVEAYSNISDYMDRRKGISGDILFIPQPNKPNLYIHEIIYGRQTELRPLSEPSFGGRSREFEIEELR